MDEWMSGWMHNRVNVWKYVQTVIFVCLLARLLTNRGHTFKRWLPARTYKRMHKVILLPALTVVVATTASLQMLHHIHALSLDAYTYIGGWGCKPLRIRQSGNQSSNSNSCVLVGPNCSFVHLLVTRVASALAVVALAARHRLVHKLIQSEALCRPDGIHTCL